MVPPGSALDVLSGLISVGPLAGTVAGVMLGVGVSDCDGVAVSVGFSKLSSCGG